MKQNSEAPKQMVENISCILPQSSQSGGLFLGNVFGAQNAAILKQYGIRAVITASAQTNISYSAEDIPSHLRIDAHDKDQYYIVEHVNDCIHFIETNRKLTNVYVHCYAGVSRSSAIVAAYLMWKYRWSLQKTINFLTFKRVVAKPNDGFMKQLQEVEAKLNIKSQSVTQQTKILNQISQQQMVKPRSPTLTDPSSLKRPVSTNGPAQIIKPQSPPLQLQNFQAANNSSQQVYQSKVDPYLNHLQSSGYNKMAQQKQMQKSYQNHNSIPLPKVLAKKQEQTNIQNDYYEQGKKDPRQHNRKSTFNDYLSPQVLPTSPRQNQVQKASLGKTNFNKASFGNKVDNNEGSLYTTMNGMNTSKKSSYESQQKSKTGSRCIIRPKDLPGYRNY